MHESFRKLEQLVPDHLVHTKRSPLYIDWDPQTKNVDGLIESIKSGVKNFKDEYKAYFERNKYEGDKMFESAPRVIFNSWYRYGEYR